MSTTTIRVPTETRERLSERVLDLYRRQLLLSALNDAYAALHNDEAAWSALEAERAEWDVTLTDGLEDA